MIISVLSRVTYCVLLVGFLLSQVNAAVLPVKNEQVRQEMLVVGRAIEQMYLERGVLLVDLYDGTTPEGQQLLADVFENVGNPTDRPRTMRDVLQPLVHFGYLDEIPTASFIPKGAVEEGFDTFFYVDEEKLIPGFDGELNVTVNGVAENVPLWGVYPPVYPDTYAHFDGWIDWRLSSWHSDQVSFASVQIHRYDVISESPFVDVYVDKTWEDMRKIGEAVERLYADYGVLLVDAWDDDTVEGRERLGTVFNGVGDVRESERIVHHILLPLVELGYLDELPFAHFIWHGLASFPYYLYMDNEKETRSINSVSIHTSSGTKELQPGEWAIFASKPGLVREELLDTRTYDERTHFVLYSTALSSCNDWELFH